MLLIAVHNATFALALATMFASGCSPRRAAERALTLGNSFEASKEIAYGDIPRQRLDVYRPRSASGAPVVVFIHGGRWRQGSRTDYYLLANTLTRRGIVVVVPDIRLFPEARFPGWVEDAAAAVKWTRDNIGRFGGDSGQIFVVGHSAGAHIITLLALDEHYLADAPPRPDSAGIVTGFVSIAGPVDTVWNDPDVQEVMGSREGWPASYPRTFVKGTAAPILFLQGDADKTVLLGNSVRLAAAIRSQGGCARAKIYRNIGHIAIIVALLEPSLGFAPVADDIVSFIGDPRRNTCPPTGGAATSAARDPG